MSKNRKKRNKPYTGADAARGPQVRRYTLTEKTPQQMWWQDNKRKVLFRGILLLLALLISWTVYSIIW